MKTYLVMGDFRFFKADNKEDALYGWLEYKSFDINNNPTMYVYNTEPENISVDEMGCIHSPKGAKESENEIELTPETMKLITKLNRRYELFIETKWEVLDGIDL